MIENNINAFKVDQIDEEMLADLIFSKGLHNKDSRLDEIIDNGYLTFKRNSYENQIVYGKFFNLKMRK